MPSVDKKNGRKCFPEPLKERLMVARREGRVWVEHHDDEYDQINGVSFVLYCQTVVGSCHNKTVLGM